MNRKTFTLLLVGVSLVSIMAAGGFLLYRELNKGNSLELGNNEVPGENLFKDPLNPGDKLEYEVSLKIDTTIEVDVNLYFSNVDEKIGSGVYAGLKLDDKKTELVPIGQATKDNPVTFTVTLDEKNNDFDVIFEMPSNLGNDYMNLDMDFNIHIEVVGGEGS